MRAKPEVESEIKHKILHKKNIELEAIFKKKCARKMIVLLLAIYRRIDSEYSSQSNYSICNSILV